MKKSLVVLFVVIVLGLASSYVFSAKEQGDGMMEKGKAGMCPMHTSMCGSMMKSQIVATEDGGVVVLVCNKLMKYDKDLNLVKETEFKIDMEEKMKKMMEKCQMMCPQKPEPGKEMMDTNKDDM